MLDGISLLGMLVVGLFLGLLGGGGGILAVPVLVYAGGYPSHEATSLSLLIVGSASSYGTWNSHRDKLVEWKTVILFAIPSFLGVVTSRLFVLPHIPDSILSTPLFTLNKDTLILGAFAILMILASRAMLKPKAASDESASPVHPGKILFYGAVIGLISGFVGAGGGFLIVPALTSLAGLPMKRAVGTSLGIISLQSLGGFAMEALFHPVLTNPQMALIYVGLAFVGLWIGSRLRRQTNEIALKRGFGWFVMLAGTFVLAERLIRTFLI